MENNEATLIFFWLKARLQRLKFGRTWSCQLYLDCFMTHGYSVSAQSWSSLKDHQISLLGLLSIARFAIYFSFYLNKIIFLTEDEEDALLCLLSSAGAVFLMKICGQWGESSVGVLLPRGRISLWLTPHEPQTRIHDHTDRMYPHRDTKLSDSLMFTPLQAWKHGRHCCWRNGSWKHSRKMQLLKIQLLKMQLLKT